MEMRDQKQQHQQQQQLQQQQQQQQQLDKATSASSPPPSQPAGHTEAGLSAATVPQVSITLNTAATEFTSLPSVATWCSSQFRSSAAVTMQILDDILLGEY